MNMEFEVYISCYKKSWNIAEDIISRLKELNVGSWYPQRDYFSITSELLKNINDAIHLKLAEQYCRKLITYDTDFKKFKNETNIKIEILKNN